MDDGLLIDSEDVGSTRMRAREVRGEVAYGPGAAPTLERRGEAADFGAEQRREGSKRAERDAAEIDLTTAILVWGKIRSAK